MTTELNLNDTPLATGTHQGATGGVLIHDGADFKSCGVIVGDSDDGNQMLLENETDGSSGVITAVTESTVTCTLAGGSLNVWTAGDTYNIYRTDTKDEEISRCYVDRMYGQKVNRRDELNKRGHLVNEEDLDADGRKIFGPGQPYRGRG